jgi:putative hydrolase of the HAD superfamily
MNCQAIIFDLFGTIVEDFAASSAGSNTADFAAALGAPYEPFINIWRQTTEMRIKGTFQTVEASIEYVCDAIGVPVTAEQMTTAVSIRLQQLQGALKPRADSVATINQLKHGGYKLGLLSNCSIEIPILWPESEFANLFHSTIFSSRERIKKPAPEIYRLVCDQLAVAPEDCVYIADGENYELRAAAEVGMRPVLIRNAKPDNGKEVLREAREWRGAAIQTLAEIGRLLEE